MDVESFINQKALKPTDRHWQLDFLHERCKQKRLIENEAEATLYQRLR